MPARFVDHVALSPMVAACSTLPIRGSKNGDAAINDYLCASLWHIICKERPCGANTLKLSAIESGKGFLEHTANVCHGRVGLRRDHRGMVVRLLL
jgi:hypothetical protein